MSTRRHCPLPEVESALKPFIHTRQETARIRKAVTEYIQFQLEYPKGPPSHLSVTCPPVSLTVNEISPETSGVRRKYLEALRADAEARQRLEVLHNELQELQVSSAERLSEHGGTGAKQENTQAYIALLCQRKRYKKLQIIQKTVESLSKSEPNPSKVELRQLVREKIGDVPEPPSSGLSGSDPPGQYVDELVAKLKKELVEGKERMDAENTRRTQAQKDSEGFPKLSTEAQVHALRHARDGLVGWIEGELAKMSEIDADAAERPSGGRKTTDEALPNAAEEGGSEDVRELYQKYVAGRTAFISAIGAAISESDTAAAPSSPPNAVPSTTESPSAAAPRIPDILPYIPTLLQVSRDERALMQHSIYLRRHLDAAFEETRRTLTRLADESHMVAPGTDAASGWALAGSDAAANTASFVEENLQVAEDHFTKIKGILDELQDRRDAFARLDEMI